MGYETRQHGGVFVHVYPLMYLTRLLAYRQPALALFGVVLAVLAFGYVTRGFVRAYIETKHALVFPMQVQADGWDDREHALSLDLPKDAPYPTFTIANSASVSIGSTTDVLPPTPIEIGPTPADAPADIPADIPADTPAEPAPADAPAEASPTPAAETPETSTTPETPAPIDLPTPVIVPTETPAGSAPDSAPTSLVPLIDTVRAFMHPPVVFATSSDASTTPALGEQASSTDALSGHDVALCSVLSRPCHTLEFTGFGVSGSLTDKKFKEVAVSFSFASRAPEDSAAEDTLIVRYFHAGVWKQAGQVYLNKELSNASNGDYFTAALDGLSAWDDLSDVRILVEYDRTVETQPARLWLDALWLDVTYQERAQDVMTGDAPAPSDAPDNVAFALGGPMDKGRELVLESGGIITMPYASALSKDGLQFRVDRSVYLPGDGASDQEHAVVYASITNSSKSETSFRLGAMFPEGTSLTDLSQFMQNVPQPVDTPVYKDVSYFCAAPWIAATTSEGFVCPASGEIQGCESVSATGETCTVAHVQVDTQHDTRYVAAWVDVPLSGSVRQYEDDADPPTGYALAAATDKELAILPGQTLYLRLTLAAREGGAQRFALEALGGVGGGLDSSKLALEHDLLISAAATHAPLKKARINEELSGRTDFASVEEPQFRFRFHTQRPFFQRVLDRATGTVIPYHVDEAKLIHADGEEEHVAVDVEYAQNGEWSLKVEQTPRAYRPGRYTLHVSMTEGDETYEDTVDFYWGVLALNTDKSPYQPGDTAHLSLAALDDDGNTLCDARLSLSITDPSGSVAEVPVSPGGGCGRNNVTELPDYVADYPVNEQGAYRVTLSMLDETGAVITSTADAFAATSTPRFTIERSGPTRIYPPSSYQMHLTVTAHEAIDGTLREAVPEGFTISDAPGAIVEREGGVQYLTWDIALGVGASRTLSYRFKAPDVSPYLFLAGAATLHENGAQVFDENRTWKIASDAVAIATGVAWLNGTTTTSGTDLNNATAGAFNWTTDDYDTTYYSHSTTTNNTQLVVKVAGDYLVAVDVPQERTDARNAVTANELDIRVNGAKQNLGVGRSAHNERSTQLESSDHLYVLLHNLQVNDYIEAYVRTITTINVNNHIAIGTQASMYAEYIPNSEQVFTAIATSTSNTGDPTNFDPAATTTVVWYDAGSRVDSSYTHSNASNAQNIQLNDQADYLVLVNIPTEGAFASVRPRMRVLLGGAMINGGDAKQAYIVNTTGHTQASNQWSGVVHATTTNSILTISMQASAGTGTTTVGSDQASIYIQKLPTTDVYFGRATTTMAGTAPTNFNPATAQNIRWGFDDIKDTGIYTHSTTTNPHQITVLRSGDYLLSFNGSYTGTTNRMNPKQQVLVNGSVVSGLESKGEFISTVSTDNETSGSMVYLLRNLTANDIITVNTIASGVAGTATPDQNSLLMLWRKNPQSSYIQDTERWYANTNAATTTDPWPSGGVDLDVGEAISTGNSVKSSDVLRLRLAMQAYVNTSGGVDAFKLQYAPGTVCSAALTWSDVGATGSGSIWRGYDNAGVADGSNISTTDLQLTDFASTTETYEEQNPSAVAPNAITAGKDGEWDWVLQDNGAPTGTSYCFRVVTDTGQLLKDYNDYPALVTNASPDMPTQSAPFDNEKVASTSPWFDFTSTDDNGEDLHYEVQVSTDPNFGSTVLDRDSSTNFSEFSNVNNSADKSPFASGQVIRFTPSSALTNGTTYWWRVRAKDPTGTNTYGSWSSSESFTVDTTVTVSTWFQTTHAQFSTDTLTNLATTSVSGGEVQLSGANTTGTLYSPSITYSSHTTGNSWGSLTWSDVHTGGTLLYHIEYFTSTSSWALIPDAALASNVTGTSTQPFNLAGLDPTIYSIIRVRADYTKTSATPVLSDWTLSWGLSVAEPTQTKLFDNEKTSTTTPTFEFTTTDPQSNTLVYQIEWSTDSTFATGVTTRTSDTNAGFSDVTSPLSLSPFASGHTVSFKIQVADAVSNGTTYWWRVRAKDPSGGNAYSLWSDYHSFTVDTSVTVSTWFQTTTAQFNTDTLTRTSASSNSVLATSDTGKIAIYRAATAGNAITTSDFFHTFDTTVRQDDIYSMSNGSTTVNLKTGYYAVLYNSRFGSSGGTNRSEMQTYLSLASTTLPVGWSQAFIRRNGAAIAGMSTGGGIIKVTSDNTPLRVLTFRTDTNPTATVSRTANVTGLQLIRLDSAWSYARLSKRTTQAGPVSATFVAVNYDREDQLDTAGFSHATGGSGITLKSAGHYLVFVNTYGALKGTNTETQVVQKLTLDGADIAGSFTTVYTRGNANTDGDYQGAASLGMIIQSTTTNQVLAVKLARAIGTAAWTINANQAGTYVDRSAITIVKLPEADFAQLNISTNPNMNPTASTTFSYDVKTELDASFSTTTGSPSRINTLIAGDYLMFTSNSASPGTVANANPIQVWRKTGVTTPLFYGQAIAYNSTTGGQVGHWSGIIFPAMIASDYVEVAAQAIGTTGTVADTRKAVEGVRIASLVEADTNAKTVQSSDIRFSDGSGPKWASMAVSSTTPTGTSVRLQLLYASSTASGGYALIPDTDLPGNSTGFNAASTSITNLSRITYSTLRMQATLTCASGNCPTVDDWVLRWSAGINISGTAKQFDQTTNVTSGTVAVAVNGTLQAGKTGTISGGAWTIANVTAFTGDVITVFVQSAATTSRAVAITKYQTSGDITGMKLYEQHLTLGSDDLPLITNTDISKYDNSVANANDLFYDVNGSNTLTVCAIFSVNGCYSARLLVLSGATYRPDSASGGNVTTRNFQNDGVFIPDGNTITVTNSWRNTGNFVGGTSNVIFSASSTAETINSTGATSTAFSSVTFGSGSGTATWSLSSPLYASSTLSINFGTLNQNGANPIGLSGSLSIGSSGIFTKGSASTTFMGSGSNTWSDASAAKQDMGTVVIDGTAKTVQLASGVKATDITIGADDTLNAGGANTLSVLGNWTNNNIFTAQTGTVNFISTAVGKVINPGNSAFYDLTFNGVGGNWSFATTTITVSDNLTITAGTVTMPTGTTTVAGSFLNAGGTFAHNNGVVNLTTSGSKSIQAGGSSFYDLTLNGSGSWSFVDTNATTSRQFTITAGSVTFPAGTFAVGGSFLNSGGTFTNNSGTLRMFATSAQVLKLNGVSAGSVTFDGLGGSWTFGGATNATTTGTVRFDRGSVTLPAGSLGVGGSWIVTSGTFVHNSGLVRFTSTATGNTIDPASSSFYDLDFNSTTGGWTILTNATTSRNASITNASAFTMTTGKTLEVDGAFTNLVGGASTTWTGSTLYLNSGTSYTINTKTQGGDAYATLALNGATKVRMWGSSASTATVPSTASLYSMNNAGVSGNLYIWGTYANIGNEYWAYATDFDGTALGGGARQVNVRLASSTSVTVSSGTFSLLGSSGATTTIDNQGAGEYSLSVTGGTLNAQYYQARHLYLQGLQLSGTPTITSLSDGDLELSHAGASLITVASTVIDQNPALQIQRMRFATTTSITGVNVTESGTPSSYWWFRNHTGNLSGEAFDSDPGPSSGNPGYIRWDNSDYDIVVSGNIFADHGSTVIGNPPCDGSAKVKLVVDYGATSYTTSCVAGTGAFTFPHVVYTGDVTLTIFLDTNGGKRAVTVTRTPTGDITNLHLYQNAVIVREEDAAALSIASMARYDSTKDSDIPFTAATSTTDTLTVKPDTELVIWGSKTFTPGGNMTLSSGGSGSVLDGRLYLLGSAVFTASSSESHSIGGGLFVGTSSIFSTASSTFTFVATTSGKVIYSAVPLTFYNLTWNGSGGAWALASMPAATTTISHAGAMTAGALSGTGDLVVQTGGLSGSGTVTMSAGLTRIEGTGNFGGSTAWQFYDLTLGSTSANTITKTGSGTTTVAHVLMLPANATLLAGSSPWVLSGGGTPFVVNGTFTVQSAPFSYTASSATNVSAATYAALTLAPAAAGSPTYTLLGGTLYTGTTTIGDGSHPVTVTADTNDPAISWGDVSITTGSTLIASNVGAFDVGGSWTNAGTFTNSSGGVRFIASATGKTITTGGSRFYDLTFNSTTGGWTILDHATSTHDTTITNAGAFTLSSSKSLEVGGTFTNLVGGASTTWTGSTLFLNSGTSYSLNTKSVSGDTYGTLLLGASTNVRMWNSSASVTTVPTNASLYSMNHAASSGALNIYGAYTRSSGSDYWDYATDFDGTDISGSPRAVSVRVASSSSVTLSGGLLDIIGAAGATTSIDVQGSGFYSLGVSGGTFNANYFSIRKTDVNGLNITGAPTITSLSYGDFELSYPGGSSITVAASAITANPLKISQYDRFATSTSIGSGYNVTATGSTASSWKFNLHYGNMAGEAFDNDPGGDPGYVRWDDSASAITIAGKVYSDEGTSVSSVCNGTQVVRLKVQGGGSYTSSCNGSGDYAIAGVNFNPGDTLTVYLDTAGGAKAATVSADPVSNIGNFDLYENRVIVRHEDTSPLTIAKMAYWDYRYDTDIPFTVSTSSPNTLTLQPNTKLLVWTGKTFAPAGNVTLQSGNTNAWDGTLELQANASFSAAGGQTHSIGGSLVLGSGASITPSTSSFTFAATTTGKTLNFGQNGLYNVIFNGVGGNWSFSTSSASVGNDLTITNGTLTMPTATTTITGSFTNNGTFMHNNGAIVLNSTASGKTIKAGGSDFYKLTFNGVGGAWSFTDSAATSSSDFTIATGTVAFPSSLLSVGGSFLNTGGAFTAGIGTVRFTATAIGKTITQGTSDFYNVTFNGVGGAWTFSNTNATTTRDFVITNGSTTLPSGVLAVGGSFTNAGTFTALTNTLRLTATTTGKSVTSGGSKFSSLLFDSTVGGWTITDNSTSTLNTTINKAASFTLASGATLEVDGTFSNLVGGAATTWAGSTLYLNSGTSYTLNTKSVSGDTYGTLALGGATNVRMWNSSASGTTVPSSASLYSMNHAAASGALSIWGTYTKSSGTDHWSYATDFDGTALGGSPRQVSVQIASSSVVTYQSGSSLSIVGTASATTTITNQGANYYSLAVTGATLNAQYYSVRNTDANGFQISGSPVITSLSNGDFELSYPGGTLLTVAGSAIDANASQVFTGMRFATTTAISGYNITRTGSPASAWSFQSYTGNLSGEAFDNDGGDACGAIRWTDSSCLFVSQEHFRFRNDDAGVGVPTASWYNASWSKRKTIRIANPNTTSYTDIPVKIIADYAASMKSDFSDLRFTDSTGTALIPYYTESTLSSASTTVWVKVPSLPASGSAVIYMYYGNAGASSASDGASTFAYFEDFESGTLSGYSGDTSLFRVATTFAHNWTYGLDAGTNSGLKTTNGIYKTGSAIARGSTIRFYQYVDSTQQDEPCTLFGVQGSAQNYAVCLDEYPVQAIEIAKNVTSNDGSGTVLASTTATFATGWYQVVVDWLTTNAINVTVYDSTGSIFSTLSTSDASYSSGGAGFSFWFQHGGWDFLSVKQYTASTPSYVFGSEQVSGGATFAAAEDTNLTNASIGSNLRLRFSVQNTGASFASKNYRLQVAPLGASLNCESVPHVNYSDVPTTSSGCGSAAACMKTTSNYTDQATIGDLLTFPASLTFVAGYAMADPSNQSTAMTLPTNTVTEAEYNFQLTNNATGNAYCFRTTAGGTDLDNYQHVAQVTVLHAPTISNLSLNQDADIALTEGATTTIYASSTVTDLNGYTDIVNATSSVFRLGAGAMCTPNDNTCYQIASTSCAYSNCSGTSCTMRCRADIQYIADPTDPGSTYASEGWYARLFLQDSTGLTAFASSSPVDVLTLRALQISTPSIDFGDLSAGADTGAVNTQTTIVNTGNTPIGITVAGTDLAGAVNIPVGSQKYATTTFAYGSCSLCQFLTGSATNVNVSLAKPTATTTPVTSNIYWGITVPNGTDASVHTGSNTFTATAP